MTPRYWFSLVLMASIVSAGEAIAQKIPEPAGDDETSTAPNECLTCHANAELMTGDLKHLYITEADLVNDLHWQKGLRCNDCHGGDASEADFSKAHFKDSGFRSVKSRADIPGFCGHCHSNPEYMRQFSPSPRSDQEAIYWTSGHGQRLKAGDQEVATCVSCHGHHDIKAVDDLVSPVYPTRVATTCGKCHSNAQLMDKRTYHGTAIGHTQAEDWKKSVHAQAMAKGDTSAPTCNDCHGNHGALPPEVGSVANACGSCHVKIGELFANTRMKHKFQEVSLPGCATCHGEHNVQAPTDEQLGMTDEAVCTKCHNSGRLGATFVGARVAQEMRKDLESLKEQIKETDRKLDHAERLGMEVREARFHLREANDALQTARTVVHSFALKPLQDALSVGMKVCETSAKAADDAVAEYFYRRIWLGLSLIPIMIVVGVLLLYIRSLPMDTSPVADIEISKPSS